MLEKDLNELYRRFRTSADLSALAEVFDAVAPVLAKLARNLTSDQARAEDLVQETFLTALEQPQTHDPERALLPWMFGILVNRARTARRRAQRADQLEAECRGAQAKPLDTLAFKELHASVEAAIAQLPRHLKLVVEGKVLGQRESRELAAELSISPGALRSRLHRGLQRLRALLPPGLATLFTLSFMHSNGLARVRHRVLGQAQRMTLAQTGGSTLGALKLGLLMMTKKTAVSLCAAGVLFFLVAIRLSGGTASEARPEVEILQPADVLVTDAEPPTLPSVALDAERSAVPPSPDSAIGVLEVLVLDSSEHRPQANTRVELRLRDSEEPLVGSTDERGMVKFEFKRALHVLSARAIPTDLTSGGLTWINRWLPRGDRLQQEIFVGAGLRLAGMVVDELGQPVAGAEVMGWCSPQNSGPVHRRTESDAQGRFSLEHLGPRFVITASASGLACASGLCGELQVDLESDDLKITLGQSHSLRGQVLDPGRSPVLGARVRVNDALGLVERPTGFQGIFHFDAAAGEATTDAEGHFEIDGLAQQALRTSVESETFLPHSSQQRPAAVPIEIVLDRGLELRGRVFNSDGQPAAQAKLRRWPKAGSSARAYACDAEGMFSLTCLPHEGSYSIAIELEGHAVQCIAYLRPGPLGGELVEVHMQPARSIAGRVLDGEGKALSGIPILIQGDQIRDSESSLPQTWEASVGNTSAVTDELGMFHFDGLYAGSFALRVKRPNSSEAALEQQCYAGEQDLLFIMDDVGLGQVALNGSVRDALTDEPLTEFHVQVGPGLGGAFHRFNVPDGEFELDGLEPGMLRISIMARGYAMLQLEPQLFEAGQQRVDLRLFPQRSLRLTVVDEVGQPCGRGNVEVLDALGQPLWFESALGSRSASTRLRQGAADLHGLPASWLSVRLEVEGRVLEYPVDLTQAREEELELTFAHDGQVQLSLLALIVSNEISDATFNRQWQGIQDANDGEWLVQRMDAGLIRYPRNEVFVEFASPGEDPCASASLSPSAEGGFWVQTTPPQTPAQAGAEESMPGFSVTLPRRRVNVRVDATGLHSKGLELDLALQRSGVLRRVLILREE